jgi:hypothetical protein
MQYRSVCVWCVVMVLLKGVIVLYSGKDINLKSSNM